MIVATVLAAALLVALAVAVSAIGAVAITRRHPPHGRFVRVAGQRIHVIETDPGAGDGRLPVLLIHGASANLDELRAALGPHLSDRRAIYFDRPGHGHSERGSRAMASPVEQARIAAGLLDALGIERALVVGHSLGASVASALAVHHPDKVAGLVFVAPATHPWPGGVTWYYSASDLPFVGAAFAWTLALPIGALVLRASAAGVFRPESMPPDYPRYARIALVLRPWTFLANARDVAGLKPHLAVLSKRYPEITVPTVIVTGDADAVVWPSIHAEGLKRDIAGARLVVIPGGGHMPHQVHPDVVMAAIADVDRRVMQSA